ncbi:MAG: hypothetical protein DWQ37_00450 [Planctomycetota bacterium]|nr:MAG: hypothetical protein DWQ37_00450 [Planctomycetota bacterium]
MIRIEISSTRFLPGKPANESSQQEGYRHALRSRPHAQIRPAGSRRRSARIARRPRRAVPGQEPGSRLAGAGVREARQQRRADRGRLAQDLDARSAWSRHQGFDRDRALHEPAAAGPFR